MRHTQGNHARITTNRHGYRGMIGRVLGSTDSTVTVSATDGRREWPITVLDDEAEPVRYDRETGEWSTLS